MMLKRKQIIYLTSINFFLIWHISKKFDWTITYFNKRQWEVVLAAVLRIAVLRSSHPEVFFEKGVLKICSKFTGEHPCRSSICFATLLKLQFGMGVFLQIGCIFSEHLYLRTPLQGYFCVLNIFTINKFHKVYCFSNSEDFSPT